MRATSVALGNDVAFNTHVCELKTTWLAARNPKPAKVKSRNRE